MRSPLIVATLGLLLLADVAQAQTAAQTHVQGVSIRWQCDAYTGQLLCNRDTLVGAAARTDR